MDAFAIAVKAFIVDNEGQLLIVKRADDDPHRPGMWEIPGGRLNPGEDPSLGLRREVKEETNLLVEVLDPLAVSHFAREDKQIVTLITFVCKPISGKVKISEEHSDYKWVDVKAAQDVISKFYYKELEAYARRYG